MVNRGKKPQYILITVGLEDLRPNMNKYAGAQFRNRQNALLLLIYLS